MSKDKTTMIRNNDTLTHTECIAVSAWALLLLCLIIGTYYFQPLTYVKLVTEDHWGEWTTFIGFFVAALFYGSLFIKSQPKKTGVWYLLLAFASFFIAMEEISWGQRLFSLSVPEFFGEKNFQNEITLHNIQGFWSNEWTNMRIAGIIFLLYGFVLPVIAHFSEAVRTLREKIHLPVPSLGISPFFVLVFVFFIFQPLLVFQELGEMFMALAICMLAVERWLLYHGSNEASFLESILNRRGASLLAIAGILALVGSFVFTPTFVANALSADGALHEHTTMLINSYQKIALFLGVFFILLALFIFIRMRRSQNNAQEHFGDQLMHILTAQKGLTMSGFALIVMVFGFGFMISFGHEAGFKNTLIDFATKKYYEKGMYRQAEALFSYIEKNPQYADTQILIYRGRNFIAMNEREKGLELLQQALETAIKDSEQNSGALQPYVTIAKIYTFMDQQEQADLFYSQAIVLESSKLQNGLQREEQRSVHTTLGDIYFEMEKYPQALSEFEKAREIAANDLQYRESSIRIFRVQNLMGQ